MIRKLLYGTDPECFAKYGNYALPPYYFSKYLGVPVSDDKKHPVFIEYNGMKMHQDGAAFEFSMPPSHEPLELFDRVQTCRRMIEENVLANFPNECEPKLAFLPTIGFELERWKDYGEDFAYASRAGCDPDMDIYDTVTEFQPDEDFRNWPWRYAGGHLHISGSPLLFSDYVMAIRCQAVTTGIAAIAYSDVPELEHDRTYRFGKPGRCRVQNYGADNPYGKDYQYGIEYRTASDRWANDWVIAREVFKWAEIGVRNLLETPLGNELLGEMDSSELERSAKSAILNADQKIAREILSHIESKL